MGVVELTKESFQEEVLGAKVPVLIDFWASWCGPCMMQGPIIEEVAQEMGDKVKICKVNVDDQASIAMDYGSTNITTLVFMKYGIFQQRMVGLQDKETIVNYLNELMDKENFIVE